MENSQKCKNNMLIHASDIFNYVSKHASNVKQDIGYAKWFFLGIIFYLFYWQIILLYLYVYIILTNRTNNLNVIQIDENQEYLYVYYQ